MALIPNEMEILRASRQAFLAGKVSGESANKVIAYSNQVYKWASLTVNAVMGAAKHGQKVKKALEKLNIIDYDQAVNLLLDPETEKLRCPIEDEPITREACLDFSGSHPEDCNGCENKVITQNKLLGEKV